MRGRATRSTDTLLAWAAVMWTLVIVVSMGLSWRQESHDAMRLATIQAQATLEKDLLIRKWAARHGRIYVPVTADSPPNPNLADQPDRDVTAPSGLRLTLLTASTFARELAELDRGMTGTVGRITSLHPLDDRHTPDEWEVHALSQLEAGATEYAAQAEFNGSAHLRLMTPLRVEASCVGCHASESFPTGELRGGISVAVPLAPFTAITARRRAAGILTHSLVWALGMAGLTWARARLKQLAQALHAQVVELAGAHALTRSLLDSLPIPVFIKDAHLRYLDCNSAFTTMHGWTAADIRGKTVFDLWPKELADIYDASDRELLASRQEHRYEARTVNAAGAPRDVLFIKNVYSDESGQVAGIVGAYLDITERKQAEQALRDQQAMLENAERLAEMGAWRYDVDEQVGHVSAGLRRIWGLSSTDVELSAALDLCHPDDRAVLEHAVQRTVQTGEPFHAEYRIIRLDNGQLRYMRASGEAVCDASGRVITVYGATQDVTDTVQAHQLAVEAAARRDAAVRAGNVGLWDWDLSTNEVHYSVEWKRSIGYEPHELEDVFETWRSRVHPDDIDATMEQVDRLRSEPDFEYRVQFRFRHRSGEYRWMLAQAARVQNASGPTYRVVGTQVDITDQKRIEQALRDTNIRLEEQTALANSMAAEAWSASAAKTEFLANMSHEIRTPMTAILGFAELILDPDTTPADLQDYVRTIRGNASHLLALINDILDTAKLEAGKVAVEQIEVSPAHVIQEVVSLMQSRAQEKGIELRCVAHTPLPQGILSDHVRLRQILLNLVGNAIKFTRQGSVTIHAHWRHAGAGDGVLELAVQDTGVGMTEEQRERVCRFEPFTQADGATTRQFGGTGLGLRITSQLARCMGGALAVKSQAGRGSTFTVTIKAALAARTGMVKLDDLIKARGDDVVAASVPVARPAPNPAGASVSAVPLSGRRILLAEDDATNRRLVTHHLERGGAAVTHAENGRLALERVSAGPAFDVILMDMQMPEVDGYTAATELRRRGVRTPVIALTAHAMSGDRDRCLQAGCDDYLTKPIDRRRLIETCRHWIDQASQPAQSVPIDRAADIVAAPTRLPDPLPSELSADPDMADLIEAFLVDLEDKTARLLALYQAGDSEALAQLAHKVKGAGGGYGYPGISDAARAVEAAARHNNDEHALKLAMNELVSLCRRALMTRDRAGSDSASMASHAHQPGEAA